MIRSYSALMLTICLLLSVSCEGQRYKPAAWDAAPRAKNTGIADSDNAPTNANVPPLPEVTDWMSPGGPKRRAVAGGTGSRVRAYRGNAMPYRGNAGGYRGNALPYRGKAVPYRGNANPYRNIRRYDNPLRPTRPGQRKTYRGNVGTSNPSERSTPYRGF